MTFQYLSVCIFQDFQGLLMSKTGVNVPHLQVESCIICQYSAGIFLVQTDLTHCTEHGKVAPASNVQSLLSISTTNQSWPSDWGGKNVITGKLPSATTAS